MTGYFFWDPNPIAFHIPFVDRPIAWYGVIFALSFFIGFYLFIFLFKKYARMRVGWSEELLKKKALLFSERLAVYIIVSTVVGARFGHVLFYEKWSHYLSCPIDIIKTWEGGLSSHGGVIGILIALVLFFFRIRKHFPMFSIRRIIDLTVVPSLFVATFIRIGNFINQEILGLPTTVPWAVVFGHPIDGSIPIPRHPAQLYEALFYFFSFVTFWRFFPRLLKSEGCLAGLFFITIFSFRFLIEFLKEEQSCFMREGGVMMGQWLSVPMILFGCVLMIMTRSHKEQEESIHLKS